MSSSLLHGFCLEAFDALAFYMSYVFHKNGACRHLIKSSKLSDLTFSLCVCWQLCVRAVPWDDRSDDQQHSNGGDPAQPKQRPPHLSGTQSFDPVLQWKRKNKNGPHSSFFITTRNRWLLSHPSHIEIFGPGISTVGFFQKWTWPQTKNCACFFFIS